MPRKRWERAFAVLAEYHTNAEVAEMLEVSEGTVSAWRNGHSLPRAASRRQMVSLARSRYPQDLLQEDKSNGEE